MPRFLTLEPSIVHQNKPNADLIETTLAASGEDATSVNSPPLASMSNAWKDCMDVAHRLEHYVKVKREVKYVAPPTGVVAETNDPSGYKARN